MSTVKNEKELEREKAPPAENAEDTAPAEEAKTEQDDALTKLQAEFDAHQDQYKRVLAEYDNFRKRTQNEKAAIYNNAVSDTVAELLPVADNIERALAQENASAEDMKKGVEMIEAQIQSVFQKLGITETGAVGEAFDPNLHNAVSHIEDDSLGENVISAVFQKGYLLGERVVRHAMVQVAN